MVKDNLMASYKYGVLRHSQKDKKKTKPKMPNQIKKDKENITLSYIIDYPTHGPRRIANELRQQGNKISEIGIYNVLC